MARSFIRLPAADFVAEVHTPEGTTCFVLRPITTPAVFPAIPGPPTLAAAHRSPEAKQWLTAYKDEVQGLFDAGALHWEVCPAAKRPLRTQLVLSSTPWAALQGTRVGL